MPLVYNIGINDAKYKLKGCHFYETWKGMLRRCYSENYQKMKPTYIGCSVCEDWLTFSKFKAWMEIQDWEGKQLDKDILFPGNKVYSPETCVFVDSITNSFITESNSSRGEYPIGVSYDKKCGKIFAQCRVDSKRKFLGYFETSEEAHNAWKTAKRKMAIKISILQTDKRVAEALLVRYN